jgi:hypothetical protein
MLFVVLRWFRDLTCDFWAENAEKNRREETKAIKSVASRSRFAPAFGRAVRPSARLSYGTRERVPCRALAGFCGNGDACSFPCWQACGKRERVPLRDCGRLFTARRFQKQKGNHPADSYGMTNQNGTAQARTKKDLGGTEVPPNQVRGFSG